MVWNILVSVGVLEVSLAGPLGGQDKSCEFGKRLSEYTDGSVLLV